MTDRILLHLVGNLFLSFTPYTWGATIRFGILIILSIVKSYSLLNEEAQMLAACCRQDRAAQQLLYETYRGSLYRMCLRYAKDPQEAEDFLHDGFIKIFQDIGQFRGEGALGAWLRRVVLNAVLQQLRRRPVLVSDDLVPETAGAIEPDFDEVLAPITYQQILGLLGELPTGYRVVFNLYYVEEKTHQEIAELLGISLGASKSQLFKAKRALREKIERGYPNVRLQLGLVWLLFSLGQGLFTVYWLLTPFIC